MSSWLRAKTICPERGGLNLMSADSEHAGDVVPRIVPGTNENECAKWLPRTNTRIASNSAERVISQYQQVPSEQHAAQPACSLLLSIPKHDKKEEKYPPRSRQRLFVCHERPLSTRMRMLDGSPSPLSCRCCTQVELSSACCNEYSSWKISAVFATRSLPGSQ